MIQRLRTSARIGLVLGVLLLLSFYANSNAGTEDVYCVPGDKGGWAKYVLPPIIDVSGTAMFNVSGTGAVGIAPYVASHFANSLGKVEIKATKCQ